MAPALSLSSAISAFALESEWNQRLLQRLAPEFVYVVIVFVLWGDSLVVAVARRPRSPSMPELDGSFVVGAFSLAA